MAETIFFLSLVAVSYSYVLYPILLLCMAQLRTQPSSAGEFSKADQFTASLIIAAYNEELRIRSKIENALSINFPGLEIIVASDCSNDATDAIVGEYATKGVRLVRAGARLGKENAQLEAIRTSKGQLLVFSDVATTIPADAIRQLAVYFERPIVGAISSHDQFLSQDGKVSGEGAYVKYEMWLRTLESANAGLVGLSGSFFAARRSICDLWDTQSPSDFNVALSCAKSGLRAVTAPDVIGIYRDVADPAKEYARKVRTVLRGMTAMRRHVDVLNFGRYGAFSWQIWSHKIMRWAVPFALVVLLAANIALYGQTWQFDFILWAQVAFYSAVVAAHFVPRLRGYGPLRLAYFFVQVNIAIVDAFLRLCSGKRMTSWQPTRR